jgi:hypothetical protein
VSVGKGSRVRAQRRVQARKQRRGKAATKSRRTLNAAVGVAALLLAAVLITASILSRDGGSSASSSPTVEGSETAALLAGIPQDGTALATGLGALPLLLARL